MAEDQNTTATDAPGTLISPDAPAPLTPAAPTKVTQQRRPAGPDKTGFYWGTGRRKTAVARVRIKPGTGKFIVNEREANQFFTEMRDQHDVVAPLKATKTEGSLDVFVNVHGGGFMGQAGAVKLGLARALTNYDATFEAVFRDNGMLTRDPREVERKKYGQAGARRRFQFSKR